MPYQNYSPAALVMAVAVIILGALTVLMTATIARHFHETIPATHNNSRTLGRALQYQLMGESFISAGTLLFAVATFTGHLNDWSIFFVSAIRVLMFLASGVTSLYLYMVVRGIADGAKQRNIE